MQQLVSGATADPHRPAGVNHLRRLQDLPGSSSGNIPKKHRVRRQHMGPGGAPNLPGCIGLERARSPKPDPKP